MSPPQTLIDKRTLRQRLRQLRAAVSTEQRGAAGANLCRYALRHRLLARGRRIGFYLPTRDEIDLLPLLEHALRIGTLAYLPEVPRRGRKLWFTRLGKRPHWQLNRYGIPEYAAPDALQVRASALDLLFVPLLGFDRHGYRLGMGGGYYDASLSFLGRRHDWHRPRLIGVAYALQEVERVPADRWDIPLDGVLTERGLRLFSNDWRP